MTTRLGACFNGTMEEVSDEIAEAVAILRRGGLVAFPTETVYGLGADATNAEAIARLYAVKRRPSSHPLIVHVRSVMSLLRWTRTVPDAAIALGRKFWPGPLTMVLERGEALAEEVTGGLRTVGLRCPNHPLALALLTAFDGAIAAPSANRFGAVSPTTAEHVRSDLDGDVDLVLDGGRCAIGIESTIVDLSTPEPAILRLGAISRHDLRAVLGRDLEVRTGPGVRAPGQLPSHYAPRARVRIADAQNLMAQALEAVGRGLSVAVLARDGEVPAIAPSGITLLRLPRTLDDFARELYAALRAADTAGADLVLVAFPHENDGLADAIRDRLQRAAGPRP